MSDSPERLLAEALRAQARNAPPAEHSESGPASEAAGPEPVVETPGGYGLLSGAGEGSLERERAALDAQTTPSTPQAEDASASATQPAVARTSGGRHHRADTAGMQVTLPWIVLLAAVLGLACGCVIGLLTVT